MNHRPVCLLYTGDADWERAVRAYLGERVVLRVCRDGPQLLGALRAAGAVLLLADLAHENALRLLGEAAAVNPRALALAFGAPRSDPALAAEGLGVHAVESRDLPGDRLEALVRRAAEHLELREEVRALRGAAAPAPAPEPPGARPEPAAGLPFLEAFREFDSLDAFFARVAEGVARYACVARAGVFALDRAGGSYRLRAGVRCLPGTESLAVGRDDPFALWLVSRAHAVARSGMGHVPEIPDRLMLCEMLDLLGADVLFPVHGRRGILGWLFLGRRVTGASFQAPDIERLAGLVEHVALLLDNALLHDEVALQRTLAETVIESIPVGVVSSRPDGTVRAVNAAAVDMLGLQPEAVCGASVTALGREVSQALLAAARGRGGDASPPFRCAASGRTLAVDARPLRAVRGGLGAVAMLRDLTREMKLREQQEHVERAAFWTELAAALSHELRNPLVAISTFAQLLPQRYADAEFRQEFSGLVSQEIARLNAIIEQINNFANPPDLVFAALAPADVAARAADAARRNGAAAQPIAVETDGECPRIRGDAAALVDALARLLVNAAEASAAAARPGVTIRAAPDRFEGRAGVRFTIGDHGAGIPSEALDKVYSPFYTTKARGIGLGLPIARRAAFDHGGDIAIRTRPSGTEVSLWLPASGEEDEAS